ncbi:MAG: hypothetical protein L0I76_36920 [Pseudonocardia sp.]|nr:hypothetical protein [Pseudonocardia sp.]
MGTLAIAGIHPDQAPELPVGVWCDAAWAAWVDLLLRIDGPERLDALQETWDDIQAPLQPQGGPSMDDWGTGAAAQSGAANLAALMGGTVPDGEG